MTVTDLDVVALPGASTLEDAVAISDLFDLAEDLGGSVSVEGVITFPRTCDLDAFCDLLSEAGASIVTE